MERNRLIPLIILIGIAGCFTYVYALPGDGGSSSAASVPLFFIYEFDFYREGNVEYSFYEHGHFFGLGVIVAEEFDLYGGYGVKSDSMDRLRKSIRFGLNKKVWPGGIASASLKYEQKIDFNPKYLFSAGLNYEYGWRWIIDVYNELSTYWGDSNLSNSFMADISYILWPEQWLFLHGGGDVEYIQVYNDYFRRIEWEPGDENLSLIKGRVGMSKYIYRDESAYWRVRGDFEADTDGVYYGVASTGLYYDYNSFLAVDLSASAGYDSLKYDTESVFATITISPF